MTPRGDPVTDFPGAQTERRGEAGPVSASLGRDDVPAELVDPDEDFLRRLSPQLTSWPWENTDVLLLGSVAVAVMTWPGAIPRTKVVLKLALPRLSVVTLRKP